MAVTTMDEDSVMAHCLSDWAGNTHFKTNPGAGEMAQPLSKD